MSADSHKIPGALLLTLSALGIFFSALAAAGIFYWLVSDGTILALPATHAGLFSFACLALLTAVLNTPALLLSIRYLAGRPIPSAWALPRHFTLGIFFVWLAVIACGAWLSSRPDSLTALIALSLPAVLLPILWLISSACRGLPSLSPLRGWGTLSLGLTAAPAIIMLLELIAVGLAALTVLLALSFNSQLMYDLRALPALLAKMPEGAEAMEQALFALAREPLIGAAIFSVIGVAAPLIEELLKPLGVWLLARRQLRPDEGYALGLISGGAFALLESAGLVSQFAASNWLSAVALRAITALLHIGLSGWVGYGIAYGLVRKNTRRAMLSILGAVVLHGLWNAMALLNGLSANSFSAPPDTPSINFTMVIALMVMLVVLAAILLINTRIRHTLIKQPNDSQGVNGKIV